MSFLKQNDSFFLRITGVCTPFGRRSIHLAQNPADAFDFAPRFRLDGDPSIFHISGTALIPSSVSWPRTIFDQTMHTIPVPSVRMTDVVTLWYPFYRVWACRPFVDAHTIYVFYGTFPKIELFSSYLV
jgi:hypothetical protein